MKLYSFRNRPAQNNCPIRLKSVNGVQPCSCAAFNKIFATQLGVPFVGWWFFQSAIVPILITFMTKEKPLCNSPYCIRTGWATKLKKVWKDELMSQELLAELSALLQSTCAVNQLKFIKTGSSKAEYTNNNLYRYSKIYVNIKYSTIKYIRITNTNKNQSLFW